MTERHIIGRTLPEAYHHALFALNASGNIVECADWNTRCKELSLTMEVTCPLEEPMISRMIPCGAFELEQYRQEMLDGILDFEIGNGWTYTYHDRMTSWGGRINQVQKVIEELKSNPSSRRAVIDVRDNYVDGDNKDPACLQHIQYFIRPSVKNKDRQLDCFVLFRSNDAVKATFMNAFALIMLQKKIAEELKVPVGTYVHSANSFHAYERDWPLLESYSNRILSKQDIYYNYSGDWDEQMIAERDSIAEKVRVLQCRKE